MELEAVKLSWEAGCNIIVGQSHFIKTVEDIAEIIYTSVPGAEFGLAFCEASGPSLIRTEGNNGALTADAVKCARAVGAGHSFFLILKNVFPINILNQIKSCQEVARIYCATANELQILTAKTEQGKGIIGVVDGGSPKGVETERDKEERKALLRTFHYKF
ncbi:MAG: adenosine monophosphate-protein transferase [Spirochaetes bacterium]|nr:adenosine monophosphate-protein transferase [Spirochaetota bacterium]